MKLLFTENPLTALKEEISSLYKSVHVGVYCPSEKTTPILKALTEAGHLPIHITDNPPEHIKHLVAFGECYIKKAMAKRGNRTITLVTDVPPRCVDTISISKSTPLPLAIIVESWLEKGRAKVIASLFSLLTDVVDVLMARGKNSLELARLRNQILDILLNPKDNKEMCKLLAYGDEVLTKEGFRGISATLCEINSKRFPALSPIFCEFFSAYIINIMLFEFTLMEKSGILIGADRVKTRSLLKIKGIPTAKSPLTATLREGERSFALNPDELNAIAFNFRRTVSESEKGTIQTEEVLQNIMLAWEGCDSDGLIGILCGQGFIDGIKNCKITS
jgi:hypothetical protein